MTSAPEKQRRLRGAGRYRAAAPAVAHRERMKAAATAVQALVGAGELVIQGRRAWVVFTLESALAGFERVQQLVARGQLDVCHTATGARCLGPGWARVRHAGMVLDICGAMRTGDGKFEIKT